MLIMNKNTPFFTHSIKHVASLLTSKISILGIHPKKLIAQGENYVCTRTFPPALLVLVKSWKHP